MPLLRASGLVAGIGSGLVLTLGCPAGASSRPSAEDIAKARQQVQERTRDLDRVTAELNAARERREDLAARAEQLVEAYNGRLVKLEAARREYERTAKRLRRAAELFEKVRAAVAVQAAQRYGGVDITSPALLIARLGDARGFLRQADTLTRLSGEQAAMLRRLQDVRTVYGIIKDQAARAYDEQRREAERVRQARDAAREAVERQIEETRRLKQEKKEISQRLDAAHSRVDRLKRARQRSEGRPAARRKGVKIPKWAARLGSGRGGLAARWALKQLGKPYVWAADGPNGFDCSGLTMRAWQRAGVSLDHWTGTQWTSGRHVPLKDLRIGDLLFYGRLTRNPGTIHHVGIYIGRGMMVHAPKAGDVVRISPIWRPDLIGATRPG